MIVKSLVLAKAFSLAKRLHRRDWCMQQWVAASRTSKYGVIQMLRGTRSYRQNLTSRCWVSWNTKARVAALYSHAGLQLWLSLYRLTAE